MRAALALLLCALAVPAYAQAPQRAFKPTGNLIGDVKTAIAPVEKKAQEGLASVLMKPFQDLADFIGSDSEQALALSTAIPELQDGHGQQCWVATRQFGEVVKAHPIPLTLKAQTDLEALRLLMMASNNLCANVHCTQVFNDLANGVRQLAPISVFPLPSLNSLCSKVPQIAVIAPISTPVPAVPTPIPAPAP